MKIVHTADWHIGKRLYEQDLMQDHQHFFDWLIELLKQEQVDALLVSGDIFDLANPSNEAKELYYSVLSRLAALNIQVVVTGGNHDSPALLNAPKALLNALNIHVVGSVPEQLDELIIPLRTAPNHEAAVVVAAIPFIRDNDLRKLAPSQSYEQRSDAVKEGIKEVFNQAAAVIAQKYPTATAIAMGHLYAHGVSTSESERDIQIGNLAGFETSAFPEIFKYIALGHIHKPQKAGSEHILYSGSPIPLSFSEKKDEKRVLLVEVDSQQKVSVCTKMVPVWRNLKQLSGDLTQIKAAFEEVLKKPTTLPTLVEVELKLEARNQAMVYELENWVQEMNRVHKKSLQILKYRIRTQEAPVDAQELFKATDIKDLQPKEVFTKKLQHETITEEDELLVKEAFQELLQEYSQQSR